MNLIELQPEFIKYNGTDSITPGVYLDSAQGIQFYCPKKECDHMIQISFADRGVTEEQGSKNDEGKPSRWKVSGTSFNNLTLTPSIFLNKTCGWHGFVTDGKIKTC